MVEEELGKRIGDGCFPDVQISYSIVVEEEEEEEDDDDNDDDDVREKVGESEMKEG